MKIGRVLSRLGAVRGSAVGGPARLMLAQVSLSSSEDSAEVFSSSYGSDDDPYKMSHAVVLDSIHALAAERATLHGLRISSLKLTGLGGGAMA